MRHVPGDDTNLQLRHRPLVRLSNAAHQEGFDPLNIDRFAKRMYARGILNCQATSLCSKLFFLGNPNKVFMYDSYVCDALDFNKKNYTDFYSTMRQLTKNEMFSSYIDELYERVRPKLDTLEIWARLSLTEVARKIRVIDRYLMVL
jgi:hypothetical protein